LTFLKLLAEPFVTYVHFKQALGEWSGLSGRLLHIHAGLLIFTVALVYVRGRVSSIIPISAVVLLAALNELADLIATGPNGGDFSFWDFANSTFWPLVIFLIARWGEARRA
jgi:hypothetical protein